MVEIGAVAHPMELPQEMEWILAGVIAMEISGMDFLGTIHRQILFPIFPREVEPLEHLWAQPHPIR
jgi:hypothetical protein